MFFLSNFVLHNTIKERNKGTSEEKNFNILFIRRKNLNKLCLILNVHNERRKVMFKGIYMVNLLSINIKKIMMNSNKKKAF
jgi:hypothetical protein